MRRIYLMIGILILFVSFMDPVFAWRRGTGYNEGDLDLQKNSVQFNERSTDPPTPPANQIKIYSKDDAGTTKIFTKDSAGTVQELGSGGGGGAHASTHENGGADEVTVTGLSGELADAQKTTIEKAGVVVGTRPRINLTEGANVTLTITEDVPNNEIDVEVAAAGGGTGSAIMLDLGDDAINESADLMEIATTGDTNNIFTEPIADKVLIDLTKNWPTADDVADTDLANYNNTPGFITGNQNITLSGDATGTGSTAITVTVVDDSHNHTAPSITLSSTDLSDSTNLLRNGDVAGGDLSGTYPNPQVTDDSHNHTGTSISGLDISNDTNLAATSPIILTDDTLSFDQAGVSIAELKRQIVQAAHGFTVGDVLHFNGTIYDEADATDSGLASEVIGIVNDVDGSDTFTIQFGGHVTGLSSLTSGSVYYVSAITPGALTTTEPSTTGNISKPVLIADSTTSGYFFNFRGIEITTPGGGSSTLQEAFDGGQTITVADGDNQTLAITNNDTTNNPDTVSIANTGSGRGLFLDQDGNGNSLVIDSESTTFTTMNINADLLTSGKVFSVSADNLTTGAILDLASDSSDTSTRNLIQVLNDNTLAEGTTLLHLQQDAPDGNGIRVGGAARGSGIFVDANSGGTGYNGVYVTTANNPSQAGNLIHAEITSASNSGQIPIRVTQDGSEPSVQIDTSLGKGILINTSGPNHALHIVRSSGLGRAVRIENSANVESLDIIADASTNQNIIFVSGDGLTTGTLGRLESTSTDTSSRLLFRVANESASATGAVPFLVQQNSTDNAIELANSSARLTAGGSWIDNSSMNEKENFQTMDVLAKVKTLPIQMFNYKKESVKDKVAVDTMRDSFLVTFDAETQTLMDDEPDLTKKQDISNRRTTVRQKIVNDYATLVTFEQSRTPTVHYGPFAEDFFAAFGLCDDKSIASRDLASVALRAIQELAAEVDALKIQNADFETRIKALEAKP